MKNINTIVIRITRNWVSHKGSKKNIKYRKYSKAKRAGFSASPPPPPPKKKKNKKIM